ncbi:carbonate dehydratase [Bacteriovorax sp. DB6_IX]|uniref:carbonate dehydratase n=1 Tax=Bacteriovorax sp. DB6_IX TaxID=1353530 RepID=UPI000389E628|nr:carbonate dehydratase [Bacteriovorax sp. DB6_IX]EQC51556.1 Carbonic anhydrase 2 [Bacteriovorax sp. DB6_IX]
MKTLQKIFKNNKEWADRINKEDPTFFERLSKQQSPKYLWIGCSDSRVPANQIIGLDPGEVFVHRNVGNQVIHTDINCLAVIQYSVDVLKVEHIIVCGHYGCGAVNTAIKGLSLGVIDNWILGIKEVYNMNFKKLEGFSEEETFNKMCELNTIQQVKNICHNSIVQAAWNRGQKLCIHGWIYGLADGLLKDLDVTIDSLEQVNDSFVISDKIDI